MINPVYVIYRGKVLDIVPADLWHSMDYNTMVQAWGLVYGDPGIDWVLTENGFPKWEDFSSIKEAVEKLLERTKP